jgi:hypothetical protein
MNINLDNKMKSTWKIINEEKWKIEIKVFSP